MIAKLNVLGVNAVYDFLLLHLGDNLVTPKVFKRYETDILGQIEQGYDPSITIDHTELMLEPHTYDVRD